MTLLKAVERLAETDKQLEARLAALEVLVASLAQLNFRLLFGTTSAGARDIAAIVRDEKWLAISKQFAMAVIDDLRADDGLGAQAIERLRAVFEQVPAARKVAQLRIVEESPPDER